MIKSNVSWDEYFMGIALLSCERSKDPNTKVGACIVDENKKVVSIGYNGMPSGCDESQLSWNRGEGLDSKYLYVPTSQRYGKYNVDSGILKLFTKDEFSDINTIKYSEWKDCEIFLFKEKAFKRYVEYKERSLEKYCNRVVCN